VCGIAGVVVPPDAASRAQLEDAVARSLLERLAHRGPDGEGVFRSERALLVHRRLAVVDTTDAGAQPMTTADGLRTIVFNGEIYNHVELRRELELLGHRFRSRSDTEVLLEAYAEWGTAALERFTGMFAFAILDRERRTLLLARDVFGIKPLFHAPFEGGIAFASELGALRTLEGVGRRANTRQVYRYLVAEPLDGGSETFFEGVRQLPPAHLLELDLDGRFDETPRRYFSFDLGRDAELSFDAAAERLRELFLENVRLHMRSDVPVGAALSGGIDSSSIVMTIRHLFGRESELHTFSYVAQDPAVDEERWIDLVGRASRAHVHKVAIVPEELARDLERLIAAQGEPFGSTSIYAQRRVFELARASGVKVMLDGQGADELFGGYDEDTRRRVEILLKQGRWRAAARLVASASRLPGKSRLWRQVGKLLPEGLQDRVRSLVNPSERPWLARGWFHERGIGPEPGRRRRTPSSFREHLHENLTAAMLPELLRYEDRNSMAFSVESRVPFLTPALASFVLSLPEEFVIAPDGTTKAVFRRAMRGIVPQEVLDRKDKIGFATPERTWLADLRPWAEAILRGETARSLGVIDHGELWAEWQRMQDGSAGFSTRAWRWINLIRWVEITGVRFA
jgi:asparagine synthase (glutamine-hydrolysing)